MTLRVIDTNVAIIANGRETNASRTCRLAAVEYLVQVLANARVVPDLGGDIQEEYHRYLNPRGQPGVGDRFYLMVLQSAPERVERIEIAKDPTTGDYLDFPTDVALAGFDKSDKKFVAAAKKAGATVASATDKGWVTFGTALAANGVAVEMVCGCDPDAWHEKPDEAA